MVLPHHLLPPPPTVEDTMEDVGLTPYICPQSAYNFERWQKGQQHEPLLLLLHSPLSAATAQSTDSSTEAVILSLPLQCQWQHQEPKASA